MYFGKVLKCTQIHTIFDIGSKPLYIHVYSWYSESSMNTFMSIYEEGFLKGRKVRGSSL